MSNWYDDLTDEQIQQLKDNEKPLGLLPQWMRDALIAMGKCDPIPRQWLSSDCTWSDEAGETYNSVWTYRLNPSWQRPKKEGRWEYREIGKSGDKTRWIFHHKGLIRSLNEAPGVVGFGGIEFEGMPDRWWMSLVLVDHEGATYCATRQEVRGNSTCYKPGTPKRVRFWVEG